MIKSYKDLEVYNLSYTVAMEIFSLSKKFPKEELYSLTSQIIRSSRSISSNIVEGWAKRVHEKKFKLHLVDALGSTAETQNWILFAKDCNYITRDEVQSYNDKLDRVGKMLFKLHKNWKTLENGITEPPTSGIRPPASNIQLPTSNIEHRD